MTQIDCLQQNIPPNCEHDLFWRQVMLVAPPHCRDQAILEDLAKGSARRSREYSSADGGAEAKDDRCVEQV